MKRAIIAATMLAALCSASHAAEIHDVTGGFPNAIALVGDIEPGDELKLRDVFLDMASKGHAVNAILLDSRGGEVRTAAIIANGIRKLGIATWVGPTNSCASACMLLFAAGIERTIWRGARLGVHSASYEDGSDADGGTVGLAREMRRYGAPAVVIGKLVTTTPDDMTLLDASDLDGWATIREPQQQTATIEMPPANHSMADTPTSMTCRSTESGSDYAVVLDGNGLWVRNKYYPVTGRTGSSVSGPTKYGSYGAEFGNHLMKFGNRKGESAIDQCW